MKQVSLIDPNPPPRQINIDLRGIDPSVALGGLGLTTSFISAWVWKYFISPKLKALQNSFQRTVEVDDKIRGRMYVLLDKYKASRVLLYQAHNGTTYISGQHLWKVTISHEVTSGGVSSVKHWAQGEPYNDFLSNHPKLLDSSGSLLRLSDNSMNELGAFKHRFLNHGVSGILTKVLRGYSDGEIIGFIEFHWADSDCIPPWDTDLENLSLEIEKITGLLLRKDENIFLEMINKLWKLYE